MEVHSRLIFASVVAILAISCGEVDTRGRVLLGQEQTGTLDAGQGSGEFWFDAEEEGSYILLLDSPSLNDLTLAVYSDYGRTDLVASCEAFSGSQMCVVTLPAGRYFLRVSSVTAGFFGGGSGVPFAFEIVAGRNEGAADAPVSVDAAGGSVTHTVAPFGASYYVYELTAPGGLEVAISPHPYGFYPSVNVRLYPNADFTALPITGTCTSTGCRFFGVPSGPIGIRVDEEIGEAAVFEIAIASTLSEGAPSEPIALTLGTNYQNASVDGDLDAYSYYSVTTGGAAGSVLFVASGTTQGAVLSVTIYSSYPDVVVGSCSSASGQCAVGNLEANTTYLVAIQTGTAESAYTLTASTGVAEGSLLSPIALSLGVAHPGQIDLTSSSYYSFTPDQSTFYTIDDGLTSVDVIVRDPAGTIVTAYPELALDAGITYSIEVALDVSDTTYTLTVNKDPYGEGTESDPVALTAGVLHASTLRNAGNWPYYGRSYYEFTTDADGGDYGLFIRSDLAFNLSTTGIPSGTCTGYSSALQTCTFTSLTANTTFAFEVDVVTQGDPRAIEFLVLDLDATEPCEPGNLACEDFTADPGFFNPNATNTKWTWVSGEYEANTTTPSCFETTSPAGTMLMAFTGRVTSTNTGDAINFTLDPGSPGTLAYTYDAAESGGVDRRRFFALSGIHTVRVCFSGTGIPKSAFLDNLAFR